MLTETVEEFAFGCCCHKPGNKCVCGVKSESTDLRLQEALIRRPVAAVKSRPTLDTRSSENLLTTGHPKLHHRNTLGHTACQPYNKSKRPVSLHAVSFTGGSTSDQEEESTPRAVDDMLLFSGSSRMYGMDQPTLSVDTLDPLPSAGFDACSSAYDYNNFFSAATSPGEVGQLFRTTSADALSSQTGWYDSSLTTVSETPGDFVTSPLGLFNETNENDWSIPSATSDFFSPSDLPLTRSQTEFSQTVSHSGESNYQSVPGLTASSSGAQSEIDGPTGKGNVDAFPTYWTDTVQFRESTPLSGPPTSNGFAFPSSMPTFDAAFKPTSSPRRHRQTYSGGSHHHAHNTSDSTTVPVDYGFDEQPVNVGHLQNLATLRNAREAAARSASQSPDSYPQSQDSELGAISIPNTEDYYDEFDFPGQAPLPSENSRQYSWLLDSA